MKTFSLFLITFLILCRGLTPAQTIDEDSNWFKEIGRYDDYNSRFDFRRYSLKEVLDAKSRYLAIVGDGSLDEWEGIYRQDEHLGHSEFTWSTSSGFVFTYTYHTLAFLDHGTVATVTDRLRAKSQNQTGSSSSISGDLIKVKFGNSHFLVRKKELRLFADEAAGLRTERSADFSPWIKDNERTEKVFGFPVFPKDFASLVRKPITVSTERIGKPKRFQDRLEDGSINTEENQRLITLDAGLNKGVRRGMSFFVDELDERIEIIRTRESTSVAKLVRSVQSDKEICFRYEQTNPPFYEQVNFPCRELKIGMSARTLSEFFEFR